MHIHYILVQLASGIVSGLSFYEQNVDCTCCDTLQEMSPTPAAPVVDAVTAEDDAPSSSPQENALPSPALSAGATRGSAPAFRSVASVKGCIVIISGYLPRLSTGISPAFAAWTQQTGLQLCCKQSVIVKVTVLCSMLCPIFGGCVQETFAFNGKCPGPAQCKQRCSSEAQWQAKSTTATVWQPLCSV